MKVPTRFEILLPSPPILWVERCRWTERVLLLAMRQCYEFQPHTRTHQRHAAPSEFTPSNRSTFPRQALELAIRESAAFQSSRLHARCHRLFTLVESIIPGSGLRARGAQFLLVPAPESASKPTEIATLCDFHSSNHCHNTTQDGDFGVLVSQVDGPAPRPHAIR